MNPTLNIITHRCNDPKRSKEIDPKKFKGEVFLQDAVILEQGMASGKTSISFGLTDQEGNYYVAQTSKAILETLMGFIKGSEDHWKANPVENIWK